MKTTVLIATLIAFVIALNAQNNQNESITEGIIQFEEVTKLEIDIEGDAAQFASMLPKERRSKKVLYFNQELALYENDNSAQNDDEFGMDDDGGAIKIKMMEPDNKRFTYIDKSISIEQREFMTRMFLIESDNKELKWRMTENQKEILGFACQEAVCIIDNEPVNAWFTTAIPVPVGPANYASLPGLILKVDINEGKQVITATSVTAQSLSEDVLIEPKKGKKVSQKEFDEIVAEKLKEMGVDGDGKGQRVIVKRKHE